MKKEIAVLGGGCFWHIEYAFSELKGVLSTAAGYMGGDEKKYPNVTYEQASSGRTGFAEVVQIEFDSDKISYKNLLDFFWKEHNPTTLNRQGPDVGTNYRSVIFYYTPEQKKIAEKSKDTAQKALDSRIVTEIKPAGKFVRAQEYHQDYVIKHGN